MNNPKINNTAFTAYFDGPGNFNRYYFVREVKLAAT